MSRWGSVACFLAVRKVHSWWLELTAEGREGARATEARHGLWVSWGSELTICWLAEHDPD